MARCAECEDEGASPCARCRREYCGIHIPDGELCVGCFQEWTKLASKGNVLLPIVVLAIAFPLFLLNPFLAIGGVFGLGFLGAQVSKSRVGGRRKRFIEMGHPELPHATIGS